MQSSIEIVKSLDAARNIVILPPDSGYQNASSDEEDAPAHLNEVENMFETAGEIEV